MIVSIRSLTPVQVTLNQAVEKVSFATDSELAYYADNARGEFKLGLRAGYPIEILSISVALPYGLISADEVNSLRLYTIRGNYHGTILRAGLCSMHLPFLSIEYSVGNTVDITPMIGGGDGVPEIEFSGSISMVNLPDSMDGLVVPVYAFAKINIDKRGLINRGAV